MAQTAIARRMEQAVRTYIQVCNDGDAKAIAACFGPEAVHYCPWQAKWLGAATTERVNDFDTAGAGI